MWCSFMLTLFFTLSLCQSPKDIWPTYFTSSWTQWVTMDEEEVPPFAAGYKTLGRPSSASVYYGNTWYDYSSSTKKQFQTFPVRVFSSFFDFFLFFVFVPNHRHREVHLRGSAVLMMTKSFVKC